MHNGRLIKSYQINYPTECHCCKSANIAGNIISEASFICRKGLIWRAQVFYVVFAAHPSTLIIHFDTLGRFRVSYVSPTVVYK
jgi:hypothetical protein